MYMATKNSLGVRPFIWCFIQSDLRYGVLLCTQKNTKSAVSNVLKISVKRQTNIKCLVHYQIIMYLIKKKSQGLWGLRMFWVRTQPPNTCDFAAGPRPREKFWHISVSNSGRLRVITGVCT